MNPISLPIAELKPALAGLSKIINKQSSLPVLTSVKIERTSEGWTALTATDLDYFATVRLEQPSEGEPASILVPFDELLKTTKSCSKSDAISIEGQKTSVTISYPIGGQQIQHQCESFPVEEFPPIPRIEGEPFAVNDQVRISIHEALECASADETRLMLNSAFIDVSDPKCHHVIGTDGRHLYSSNSFNLALKNSLIVPDHKFLGWREFNKDGEWQLKVSPEATDPNSAGHFQISSRRWQFISRQIEGKYPEWRKVLPRNEQFNISIEIDPAILEQVTAMIQRLPCHDPINLTIGLELIKGKPALLAKSTAEANWTKVEVSPARCSGKDVTVFVNRQFLTKALKCGLSKIEIIDSLSPLKFSNQERQIIVMPVRADSHSAITKATSAAEPTGTGQAETVNSEADKPTNTSIAATQERRKMANQPTNGAKAASTADTSNGNEFDAALQDIETLKESLQESLGGLKSLSMKLKLIQREQKANVREFNTVRQTLRNLQSVKL